MSLLFGQTPAALQSGMGSSAGPGAPPARRCQCLAPTTSTTSTTKASPVSGQSLVTIHGAGTSLGSLWLLLLPRCLLLLPGHAYRYCSADGTWAMALSINKTWANYTECALLFSSESRSRQKVTVSVRGAGSGLWVGARGSAGGRGLFPLHSSNQPCSPRALAWSCSSVLLLQEVFDRLHLMYTVGYSISLASLIVAICILSYFK